MVKTEGEDGGKRRRRGSVERVAATLGLGRTRYINYKLLY